MASPATRAQQTAAALGVPIMTSPALGTGAAATDILAAARWQERPGVLVIVGHQPALGRVAALLLSGRESDWNIGKGALWWLQDSRGDITLRAVLDPDLLGGGELTPRTDGRIHETRG